MNKYIVHWNKSVRRRTERIAQLVCNKELWVFLGIILIARIEGIPGGDLWKDGGRTEGYKSIPNLDKDIMHSYRFKQIKYFITYMWADEELKAKGDPWWQIVQITHEFNECRRKKVRTSNVRVADESMSAFRPRTTKHGNLPHLSFIKRKPEDLGTELKTAACPELGIMEYIEIQRSKNDTHGREFSTESMKRVTTTCCMRIANACYQQRNNNGNENATSEIFMGDSWFGSVPTAIALQKKFSDGKSIGKPHYWIYLMHMYFLLFTKVI